MASNGRSNRGFAAMDPEKQRKIASNGGKARSRNRQLEAGRENQ